ncbi:MAG: DMT family transporter [Bacteroidetes bacterium]|nr:DMT family transporter [Bacteroidota bacterium]
MFKNKQTQAHLALIAANIIFGVNFSFVKLISPSLILPFGLNLMRVVTATALFWLLFLFKPVNGGINKKHIPRFLLCALTGVALNQLMFIKGLTMTTPIHAALLILTTPVILLILALFTRTEQLTLGKIAGLACAFGGGTLLVMSRENSALGSDMLTGDIFIVINAVSYAVYMILVKPLIQHYTPIQVTRWIFTIGLFYVLPFCWNDFQQTRWDAFTNDSWLALALITIGATFFAYLFIAYGIHYLSPTITGAYIYTQPVFSAVIAIVFMNEKPALYKLVAAVLIFGGVYLINKKGKETTKDFPKQNA